MRSTKMTVLYFNIFLEGGSDHKVEHAKCLSARITTDGFAVGAGNDEISNCFFYVGDNAVVYSGGAGYHHISDCIIGTTCAAIFPHMSIGQDRLENESVYAPFFL